MVGAGRRSPWLDEASVPALVAPVDRESKPPDADVADHDEANDTPVTHDRPVSNDTPVDPEPRTARDSGHTPCDTESALGQETSSLHEEFGMEHPVSQLVSEFVELLDDVELGDDPELDQILEMLEETYDLESLTRESLREIIDRLRGEQ